MRKVILMLLLAVVSNSAMAEWVKLGESDEITSYANPDTIRRSGNKVKMWRMFDYKTPQADADSKLFMSSKGQEEYDCKGEQSRNLALVNFSGSMGDGNVIDNLSGDDKWSPITPDSISEHLFKYACRKK